MESITVKQIKEDIELLKEMIADENKKLKLKEAEKTREIQIKKMENDKAGTGKQFVILANSCFGENYYRVGDILTLTYSGHDVRGFRVERTGKNCTFSLSIAKEKMVEYNPSLAVNKGDKFVLLASIFPHSKFGDGLVVKDATFPNTPWVENLNNNKETMVCTVRGSMYVDAIPMKLFEKWLASPKNIDDLGLGAKDHKLDAMTYALKAKEATKPDIQKIADHYGATKQSKKLIEECGELITAIAKNAISAHVVEEMADVCVVIEQLLYLTKTRKQFDEIRAKKIARQIGRIEEEIDQANTNAGCKLVIPDLNFSFDLDCGKSAFVDLTEALRKASNSFGGKQ